MTFKGPFQPKLFYDSMIVCSDFCIGKKTALIGQNHNEPRVKVQPDINQRGVKSEQDGWRSAEEMLESLGSVSGRLQVPTFLLWSGLWGARGGLAEVLAACSLWEAKVLGRMLLPLEFCAGVALPALVWLLLVKNLCHSCLMFFLPLLSFGVCFYRNQRSVFLRFCLIHVVFFLLVPILLVIAHKTWPATGNPFHLHVSHYSSEN